VDCVQSLIAAGETAFVEAGPGKVLCGLLRQIDPAQQAMNVEDNASLDKTLSELQT
jgi:[acyl-carrier-protein] S-malonyltransferase